MLQLTSVRAKERSSWTHDTRQTKKKSRGLISGLASIFFDELSWSRSIFRPQPPKIFPYSSEMKRFPTPDEEEEQSLKVRARKVEFLVTFCSPSWQQPLLSLDSLGLEGRRKAFVFSWPLRPSAGLDKEKKDEESFMETKSLRRDVSERVETKLCCTHKLSLACANSQRFCVLSRSQAGLEVHKSVTDVCQSNIFLHLIMLYKPCPKKGVTDFLN